jgi:hypothetical protein
MEEGDCLAAIPRWSITPPKQSLIEFVGNALQTGRCLILPDAPKDPRTRLLKHCSRDTAGRIRIRADLMVSVPATSPFAA